MTGDNRYINWFERLRERMCVKPFVAENSGIASSYYRWLFYFLDCQENINPTRMQKMKEKLLRKLFDAFKQQVVKMVDSDIVLCCVRSREILDRNRPLKILVDNSVIGQFAFLFSTGTYKKTLAWPNDESSFEIDCVIPEPIYRESVDSKLENNMRFVPSLLYLFKQNYLEMFSSDVLLAERKSQMVGMYNGMGIYDYALFSNITLPSLDGYEAYCFVDDALEWKNGKIHIRPDYFQKRPTLAYMPNAEECMGEYGLIISSKDKDPLGTAPDAKQRLEIWLEVKREEIPEFSELVKCLGKNNIKDAWHIYTANEYGLDFFVTMDFNIVRSVQSQKGNKVIKALNVQVVTPEDLGRQIEMRPMSKGTFQVLHKNTIFSGSEDDSLCP